MSGLRRAIGILGGMGPEASVHLYGLLVALSASEFGAVDNSDFPEIILDSVPVPDFISDGLRKDEALAILAGRVTDLDRLDLCCLAIACNTAHVLLPALQSIARTPFVSMIEAVASQVALDGPASVVVLGTPSTVRSGLYRHALDARGIRAIEPDEPQLRDVEAVIRRVIENRSDAADAVLLTSVADALMNRGGEAIVLGCTELPLVFPGDYSAPVYSSLDVLARALLRTYYGSLEPEKHASCVAR